jgi:hypothetical protein
MEIITQAGTNCIYPIRFGFVAEKINHKTHKDFTKKKSILNRSEYMTPLKMGNPCQIFSSVTFMGFYGFIHFHFSRMYHRSLLFFDVEGFPPANAGG